MRTRYQNRFGFMPPQMRDGGDIQALMEAFEGYHETTKGMAGEVKSLGEAVDELTTKIAALQIGGATAAGKKNPKDLADFSVFVRTGKPFASMTEGSGPEGGYTVSDTIDNTIQSQLVEISPLRRYAKIVMLGAGNGAYKFNVNRRGATSGWVGETDARPETNTPALGQITIAEGELYANPKVSQYLLDDSSFNIDSFVQENLTDEFAVQEGAAFVSGNGMVKPRGYLTAPVDTAADAVRAFGTIQYLKTGGAAGFADADPGDALIDLVYSLRPSYRAGPGVAWMMNSTTAGVVRKIKDEQGRYMWQDNLQSGQPPSLLGYPVGIDVNMPDLGANNFPIAFGNWQLGYRILDRLGTRILRDPYSDKPFVHFYTTKRVGGNVADSNAIKLLKCAA
ncbi:MAG TPA: phage major capsid protein [Rhizomicrobium sp.]